MDNSFKGILDTLAISNIYFSISSYKNNNNDGATQNKCQRIVQNNSKCTKAKSQIKFGVVIFNYLISISASCQLQHC